MDYGRDGGASSGGDSVNSARGAAASAYLERRDRSWADAKALRKLERGRRSDDGASVSGTEDSVAVTFTNQSGCNSDR